VQFCASLREPFSIGAPHFGLPLINADALSGAKIAQKEQDDHEIRFDSQFACPGAESGADLCWLSSASAALVLWAYPSRPTRVAS
jgi:hypothetical protein